MGLYLTVFDSDRELDGVEVGSYADFESFRSTVAQRIEGGVRGARCPTLMLHSDCDGQWSPDEAAALKVELDAIADQFRRLPAEPFGDGWKQDVARVAGLRLANLYECFFDVDGEPLLDRCLSLVKLSIERRLPILFQ